MVGALSCSVPPVQIGVLLEAVGAAGVGLTVSRAIPVVDCRSGLVIVTFCVPGVAEVVFSDSVACRTRLVAGLPGTTMFVAGKGLTLTPPVTVAVRWEAKPGPPVSGPGSKNSRQVPPPVHSPFVQVGAAQSSVLVIVEVVEGSPAQTAGPVASARRGGADCLATG